MYLTEQIGVSTEDLESLDGRNYFEKMIAENPNPMITPYGVVYRNSNEIVQTYDGRNFPYYQYENTPITLLLSGGNGELPISDTQRLCIYIKPGLI